MEAKREVKHIVLIKYKDDVSPEKFDEIIKGFQHLVNVTNSIKDFKWGTNVSRENRNEGYTHVFEFTFESEDAIEEYVASPAHVEFANKFVGSTVKILAIDYVPSVLLKS
ncbi:hypothetical protein NE237_006951 [Protea cynaroides]|uniref:Stress-response A/B barrel domain-containing protein n=1 Tax=Protea cynaroides TaxID=273540 RepID=A0A9Q0KNB1_9MAGN|nr:hypothetical protein NE237_006951 [Protea cynaroides]